MGHYLLIILIIGLAMLGMAWMPAFTKKTGISYSIIYTLIGVGLYYLLPKSVPPIDPFTDNNLTLHFSEVLVIISIMGSGIKIDRPFSLRTWQLPLRLISITMILSIGMAFLLGYYFLGLALPSALLLASLLAPTDPVLADDIQVGPPNTGRKFNVKFALTAESGLNDGFAFPFVWLAIAIAVTHTAGHPDGLIHWFIYDVLYKLSVGLLIGYVTGRLSGILLFRFSKQQDVIGLNAGFVAFSLCLIVYGICELSHGYGFVSVFILAITLRHYNKEHEYHQYLSSFTEQIEKMLIAVFLLYFGAVLAGGALRQLTWQMMLFSFLFVFAIRPITGLIGLQGTQLHRIEKAGIAFFGIRGVGSVFYLTFALKETSFPGAHDLWTITCFTILLSIIIHGLSATKSMNFLEKRFSRKLGKLHEH